MTEHLNWGSKRERPSSDLPISEIAREFIMRTIRREDQSRHEPQTQEEELFGPNGFGVKLLNRFYEQSKCLRVIDDIEYRSLSIQVFQKPESAFESAVLLHLEAEDSKEEDDDHRRPAILFNNEVPGISVHIACEIEKLPEIEDPIQEPKTTFAISVVDENGAEVVVFRRGQEFRCAIKEGDNEFRFEPSVNSIVYLNEIFGMLYQSKGSDEE